MRSIAKRHIESMEMWARRVINQILTDEFDNDYFHAKKDDDNSLFNNKFISRIEDLMKKDTDRFKRPIDATLIEDIVYILCREDLYPLFKDVLSVGYPDYKNAVRFYLDQIKDIRNKLNHTNAISLREAEKAICYSNDFINSVQSYYSKKGNAQDFNVPTFMRLVDSLGNEFHREDNTYDWEHMYLHLKKDIRIRAGNQLSFEIEVDPSFDRNDYTLKWEAKVDSSTCITGEDETFCFTVPVEAVGRYLDISCSITTNKKWHRIGVRGEDDFLKFNFWKVLPPIDDLF